MSRPGDADAPDRLAALAVLDRRWARRREQLVVHDGAGALHVPACGVVLGTLGLAALGALVWTLFAMTDCGPGVLSVVALFVLAGVFAGSRVLQLAHSGERPPVRYAASYEREYDLYRRTRRALQGGGRARR